MAVIEDLQAISNALAKLPLIVEIDNPRVAEAVDQAISNIINQVDDFIAILENEQKIF